MDNGMPYFLSARDAVAHKAPDDTQITRYSVFAKYRRLLVLLRVCLALPGKYKRQRQ